VKKSTAILQSVVLPAPDGAETMKGMPFIRLLTSPALKRAP